MAAAQAGIQQLLQAETKAQEIISAARKGFGVANFKAVVTK